MIADYRIIQGLFEEISKELEDSVRAYAIGGAVLLYLGLKSGTKDIDLIVESKQEFFSIQKTLKKIGFQPQIPGKGYARMNLSQIFQKDDVRIDLFEKKVCGRFSLSEGMKQRGKSIHNLRRLRVIHCANEDIFLFKTITEREGDLDDCLSLARTDMGWDQMLKELKSQIQKSKQDVWVTWIGERLDILQERGLIIPIKKDIDKLRDGFFESLE